MSFPPRLVSILVPVQCLFVLLGWAICRKLVRVAENGGEDLFWLWPMPGTIWFAAYLGWTVAAISCAWGIAATVRAEVDGNMASLQDRDAQAGLALTGIICLGALWCVLRAVVWVFGPAPIPLQVL